MNITKEEYAGMVKAAAPKSTLWKDCLYAFAVGGLICVIGQALTDTYQLALGMELKDARCMTSITLVLLSAVLTALSLYDDIARKAGAGTLVPITGFANAVVAPAMEFRSEGFIMGTGARLFTIAGPVIVYGTVSSILYGLILCTVRMLT